MRQPAGEASRKGSTLSKATGSAACSGDSSTCSTDPKDVMWGSFTTVKKCSVTEACNAKTGTCDAVPNACASGQCCDLSTNKIKAKGAKCGTKASYKYQCKGDTLSRSTGYASCDGSSTACSTASSAIVWSGYATFKKCSATQVCNATKGTCDPIPGACTSGGCCDTVAKKIRLKGSKCTTSSGKTVLKCDGTKIVQAEVFQGCDGQKTSCSTLTANNYQSPWVTKTDCAGAKKVCQQSSPSSSPMCVLPTQCTSGQCCDLNTKQFRTKGTACGVKNQTKYACDAKGNVTSSKGQGTCTGTSSTCSTAEADIKWDAPQTIKVCVSGVSTCNAKTAKCDPIPGGCSSGGCCDPATKKVRAQGSKCTTSGPYPAKKCDGAKIVTSTRYFGCNGKTATCSKDASDYYFAPWKTTQDCGALNGTCVKNGNNYQCQQCTSGTCCNLNTKLFHKSGKICGSLQYKYSCSAAGGVLRASAYPKCSGKSATCSSADADLQWSSFGPYKQCGKTEVCNAKTGTCDAIPNACTSGQCCDLTTKKPKAKGTKCGSQQVKYQCSGSDLGKATGYATCTGSSTTCSTNDVVWSGFVSIKKCTASQVCNAKTGTCDAAAPTCSSGQCCDLATKKPKAKGTKCGSPQYKYQCSGQEQAAPWAIRSARQHQRLLFERELERLHLQGRASGTTCNATKGTCDSGGGGTGCSVFDPCCFKNKVVGAYKPCYDVNNDLYLGETKTVYKCEKNAVYAQSSFTKMCDGKSAKSCSSSFTAKGWPMTNVWSTYCLGGDCPIDELAKNATEWKKDAWMRVTTCGTCVFSNATTPPKCLRPQLEISVEFHRAAAMCPGEVLFKVTVKNSGAGPAVPHNVVVTDKTNGKRDGKVTTSTAAGYTVAVTFPLKTSYSSKLISFSIQIPEGVVPNSKTPKNAAKSIQLCSWLHRGAKSTGGHIVPS